MTDNLWTEPAGERAPPPMTPKRGRRWPLLVVAALVLAAIYAWVAHRSGAAQANVLHIGSQRGGTKALMLASGALDGAPYRVDWSEFPAAQNLLEAIGAGAVDVGLVGDAPFQFAYQSGQPVRAIAAQSARPRPAGELAILVPHGSVISGIGDLRGRRIATTRGSIGHYLILRVLEQQGLKAADVEIVFLSPGDAKAAFGSGAIDAWATWSPYTATAFQEGARSIADGKDYLTGYGFDAGNAQAIVVKRAIVSDFLRREAAAMRWARTHQPAYAAALAKDTGLPLPVALFHVSHLPMVRVPIDDALKAEERDVVDRFRRAGALGGAQPLDAAYVPLDQGGPDGAS